MGLSMLTVDLLSSGVIEGSPYFGFAALVEVFGCWSREGDACSRMSIGDVFDVKGADTYACFALRVPAKVILGNVLRVGEIGAGGCGGAYAQVGMLVDAHVGRDGRAGESTGRKVYLMGELFEISALVNVLGVRVPEYIFMTGYSEGCQISVMNVP